MKSTSGALGFIAACTVGNNIIALIDKSPSVLSRDRVLPVLLDSCGKLLHVEDDLKIDNPRFADAIQTAPNEAIIVVTSRPDGIGLVGIPHFYRCTVEGGRLRVKDMGTWRAGISIQSTSFFLRDGNEVAFAGMYAATSRQTVSPPWELVYGTFDPATRRITPGHISTPPVHAIDRLHAVRDGSGRWLFAVALDHHTRIEVWEDPGDGRIRQLRTLAATSAKWSELSSPMIVRRNNEYLVLWRAWNGKTRGDVCDASLWSVESDAKFSSTSSPKRWSQDRAVPSSHIRLCQHVDCASLFWQNGMNTARSPGRWTVLRPQSSLASLMRMKLPLRPPFPSYIVQTPIGYVALRSSFRMTPYEWSLTAEVLASLEA